MVNDPALDSILDHDANGTLPPMIEYTQTLHVSHVCYIDVVLGIHGVSGI